MNGELAKTLDHSGTNTVTQPAEERGREGEREGEVEEEGKMVRGDCIYWLEQLAYLHSGDKGNTANIGIHVLHVHVHTCKSV